MSFQAATRRLPNVLHLPIELTRFTFEFATQYDIRFGKLAPFSYDDALSLSHVCRHWRAVSLTSPTLWCYIDLTYPSRIFGTFIQRAGKHNLQVYADLRASPYPVGELAFRRLATLFDRVETLQLRVSLLAYDNFWIPLAGGEASAPVLNYLFLDGPTVMRSLSPRQSTVSNRFPSLKRLYLDDPSLPSYISMFPASNFRHIQLSLGYRKVYIEETWLHEVLRAASGLLYLDLQASYFPQYSPPRCLPQDERISLPSLRNARLFIDGPQPFIWHNLQTPARIVLEAVTYRDFGHLKPEHVAHLPVISAVQGLLIHDTSSGIGEPRVHFRGFDDPSSVDPTSSSSSSPARPDSENLPGLHIILTHAPPKHVMPRMVASIFEPGRLQSLTLRRLDMREMCSSFGEGRVFETLIALRELYLVDVDALITDIFDTILCPAENSVTVPFPSLRKFMISTSSFQRAPWNVPAIASLCACLEVRKVFDAPLGVVYLNCPPTLIASASTPASLKEKLDAFPRTGTLIIYGHWD